MKSLLFLGFVLCVLNGVYAQSELINSKCAELEKKGDIAFGEAKYDLSVAHFKNAMKCALIEENKDHQSILNRKIGDAYASVSEQSKAMNYYLEAMQLSEKLENYENQVATLISIASLKMKMDRYDEAIGSLVKVKEILSKHGELPLTYSRELYQMLGVCLASKGEFKRALYYFERCSELYIDSDRDENYGGILNNIGAIYSKQGEHDKARINYQKALDFFEQDSSELGVAVTKGNMAYLFQKEKKYLEAIPLYDVAIPMFDKYKAYHYLSSNYLNLSDLYKAIGDYKNSMKYLELHIQNDQIAKNQEAEAMIHNLEMKHEIQKKDKEIKFIEQENQLKATQKNITIIVLISILGLIILVYTNLRVAFQRTRLKNELAEKEKLHYQNEVLLKEKDLEILALKIIEKNNFLKDLQGDLNNLNKENDPSVIQTLKHEINYNVNLDKERLEFEQQIDQLQRSFVQKLESTHPNLTKMEKRLCSLLLMDLSAKEMAVVMNISEESVKKNKYRLRKKLELPVQVKLDQYLRKLS
ncbi:MAG: tetratricopeptide repeat protein [Bacteroidetes bacterium]|nr:MAG: tetratricopeptide repeat protein [Bacteroidota bacterium]